MKAFQKITSGLLAICMVITMLPLTALAEEVTDSVTVPETEATLVSTEETTMPTEVYVGSSEETIASTESATVPSENVTEPAEEVTDPTEETAVETEPTEEAAATTEVETTPVEESTAVTVHFYSSEPWDNVYAYVQDSSGSDNEFPGVELSENAYDVNWYDMTVTDDDGVFSCIFNDGTNQTDTITIDYSDDSVVFWYYDGELFNEKPAEMLDDAVMTAELILRDATEVVLEEDTPVEVTRAQWVQSLVDTFSMTVEEDNYPDNYFSDLTGEEEYYRDILVAVEFGVIDLDAGLPFCPDDAATREFAAHTLNFALGFQLNDGVEYTFTESAEVTYPNDIQIAIDRGWFTLSDGAFLPDSAITAAESAGMLADAESLLATETPDGTKENNSKFAEGVVEVPKGTKIQLDDSGNLVIIDSPVSINVGDIFIAYDGEFPVAFVATAVNTDSSGLVVSVTTDGAENAITDFYYNGTIEANLEDFVPSEATTLRISDYSIDAGITTFGISYDNNTKTLNASKNLTLKQGLDATINCDISNIRLDLSIDKANDQCRAVFYGTTKSTFDIHGDMVEALTSTTTVTLGYVPIMFGVAYIELAAECSLSGEIALVWQGDIGVGFSYSSDDFRLVKNFTKKSFSFSAEMNAQVGIRQEIGIDLWLLKANIWASAGAQMNMKDVTYSEGTPERCKDFEGFLYVKTGASAKVFGVKNFSKTEDVIKKSNSPVRVHYHHEDDIRVDQCTRSDEFSSYSTSESSKYFNSSYGNVSSSYTDSSGNTVKLYEYTLDENNNATITAYNGSAYTLSIPSMIDSYTVVAIGAAFQNNTNLGVVRIPSTVSTIGDYAFAGCINLVSATIPSTVISIGNFAFRYCTKLITTIPTAAVQIGDYAFEQCDSLTEISIPNTVTLIGSGAFYGCNALGPIVTVSGSGVTIGKQAFSDCANLKTVYLPDSATLMYDVFSGSNIKLIITKDTGTVKGEYLWIDNGSWGVTEIEVSEGITAIGIGAFSVSWGKTDHADIKSVKLPSTITSIGSYAFNYCVNLAEIVMPEGNEETLSTLGAGAFMNCSSLKKINIPLGIKEIAEKTFSGCTALTEVVLPTTINTIGYQAFYNCTTLAEIVMPEGSDDIAFTFGDYAFCNCDTLREIQIPKGTTTIGFSAFSGCENLNTTIPASVTSIGGSAFATCTSLGPTITLSASEVTIGENAFEKCSSLETVYLPDSAVIGNWAFLDDNIKLVITCDLGKVQNHFLRYNYNTSTDYGAGVGIAEVEVSEGITEIGDAAFYGCGTADGQVPLTCVVLPSTVIVIGTQAFYNCTTLAEVVMPEGSDDIAFTFGDHAFYNCSSMENVMIPLGVKEIGDSTFYGCSSMVSVNLPTSVVTIGSYCFYNCDALTSITIGNTVTSIGASSFSSCDLLKEVTLGEGLTSIPEGAFQNCVELEEIIVPYYVTSIEDNAFSSCTKLTKVILPEGLSSIGTAAFSYTDTTVIYGVSGTYAETWANENGFQFVAQEVAATEVSLNKAELTLNKGASEGLVLTVIPADSTDLITWKSSNTAIATVSDQGVVTAVGVGSATIKVTVGSLSASCEVTVVQPVTSISLNRTSLSLQAMETYQLNATPSPTNANNQDVTWSSSDITVATVDENGLVTAVAKGSATITVTAADGSGVTKTCAVTVTNSAYIADDPTQMESSHNYPNNCSDFWIYTYEGAVYLKITFDENTMIEDGFDYLKIYDGTGNLLGEYSGAQLAGQTITVPGDTVKIQMASDGSGNEWGYKVTQIIAETQTHEHTPDKSVWLYDENDHWHKCTGCEEKLDVTAHSGGTATCADAAVCAICGVTYGNTDIANHSGGTEIRNAKDATESEEGYTGDTHCLGCGELLASGEAIPVIHVHSYTDTVTAPTCTEKGYTTYTCACGDSYTGNETLAAGHNYINGVCTACGAEEEGKTDILWGDADGNGRIQTNDAKLILQYCAEMVEDTGLNLSVCDVDGNGRYQTNDAKLILQYCAEMIEKFPAEE